MPPLQQEFPKQHVDSSDNISKLYTKFEGSKMINFGTQNRRTSHNFNGYYSNHHRGSGEGGGGIEFRAHNEHESGVTSPPLWKSSPPKSPPTETTPLQSQPYNHHHYRLLSPTSRLQAIARGKEELMEMVKNMPESNYELSLKDLVEHSRIQGSGQTTVVEERGVGKDYNKINSTEKKKKKKKKSDKPQLSKSGSMNNGPFLLKMFVPNPLGLKKRKSSTTGLCAKVSPKPIEGEKFADKDWWKRRLSFVGESEKNGSSSISGSSGSSDSSRSRNKSDFLPGCLSFLNNRKSKTKEQRGSLF
ncbi:Chlorohydroquinone/hydroquinone 1,2-dioxygenase [Thalictrum thalictroides]|uniref:Chlorohydroquinone/hydroquinone 1,2-dioxygenase n=1 Tax=Thalictrum thalictroides TaxID=46969 RepID=A0A7J6WKP1_THATH|nr:Chlorohydroquinone/hydroquinone 1,2-dioxygenase [Thalictrum thalictroides]